MNVPTRAGPPVTTFSANLDGGQGGTDSAATGWAEVSLDDEGNLLSWTLSWSDFVSEVTAIHFHGPAEPGEDAVVQVELGFISGLTSPSEGSTNVSSEQRAELLANLWYINIHTEDFPLGEIRGQVIRTQPTSTPTMTATAVPTATTTPDVEAGDASCDGTVNAIDATFVLQFTAALLSLPCQDAGDANVDGTVNALDAALILQFTAGLLDRLPP